jgi:hypothetical protein
MNLFLPFVWILLYLDYVVAVRRKIMIYTSSVPLLIVHIYFHSLIFYSPLLQYTIYISYQNTTPCGIFGWSVFCPFKCGFFKRLFHIGTCTNKKIEPVPIITQSLLTSFINNITLSNRTIAANGPTPEDQALNYLIVNDTTFNFSQLLTLNSTMTNMVQFRIRQRYALLTLWFQQAFTNTSWTNRNGWLVDGNECDTWYRISCTSINLGGTVGMQNVVTAVELSNNNIQGTIPADLGLLTALIIFGGSNNGLTGTLPVSIGQWTSLTYFSVVNNALTGPLPVSIGQWTALTYFSVSTNALTGTLPASIGQWTALNNFRGSNSGLTGTLPVSIGQWTALALFSVFNNTLTGTLPVSIGQWTALTFFNIPGNALTGTIPASIGNWSQIQFAYFDRNIFTGIMPNGICTNINETNGYQLEADCLTEINCTCCTFCYE